MDERIDSDIDERLSVQEPALRSQHESLPADWTPYSGVRDLVGALVGEREDQRKIAEMGLQVACMLLTKNRQYGNAALDPLRVFSRDLPPSAMINVRLDDKLSRLSRGSGSDDEDPIFDLAGYLVLLLIAQHDDESPTSTRGEVADT